METAPSLRSFPLGSAGNISHPWHSSEKPGLAAWHRSGGQDLTHGKLTLSVRQAGITVLCAKAPKETVLPTSDVPLDDGPESSTEKHGLRSATLSNAIQALILQICDETSIAEVHMRVGEFELDLKRNVGATNGPVAVAPPVPTAPMDQSTPATPSRSSQKSSTEKANPFPSFSSAVSSKLASLEAAGITGYKLVASPRVGSFRKGRTVKGKKQPPICKQGDVIKEGQVIGYVDQFGTELPVKSDVAGEVLKLLFDEGEAVGYGDPLVAVLPSFHGLN